MLAFFYGLAGIVLGSKMLQFSKLIMKHKGKEINTYNIFLYSKLIQVLICLFNGGFWFVGFLLIDNKFSFLLYVFNEPNFALFEGKVFLLREILSMVFATINNTIGGKQMKRFVSWLKEEESGQGMVEYGLILALVAVVNK